MSHSGQGRTRDAPLDLTGDSDGDEPSTDLSDSGRANQTGLSIDTWQQRESRKVGVGGSRPQLDPSANLPGQRSDGKQANMDRKSSARNSSSTYVDLTAPDDEDLLGKFANVCVRGAATATATNSNSAARSVNGPEHLNNSPFRFLLSQKRPREDDDVPSPSTKRVAGDRPVLSSIVPQKSRLSEHHESPADFEDSLMTGETSHGEARSNHSPRVKAGAAEALSRRLAHKQHSAALLNGATVSAARPNGGNPAKPGVMSGNGDGSAQVTSAVVSQSLSKDRSPVHDSLDRASQSALQTGTPHRSGIVLGSIHTSSQARTYQNKINGTSQQRKQDEVARVPDASPKDANLPIVEAQDASPDHESSPASGSVSNVDRRASREQQNSQQSGATVAPAPSKGRYGIGSLLACAEPSDGDDAQQKIHKPVTTTTPESAKENRASVSSKSQSRAADPSRLAHEASLHYNNARAGPADKHVQLAADPQEENPEYLVSPALVNLFRSQFPQAKKTRPVATQTQMHERREEENGEVLQPFIEADHNSILASQASNENEDGPEPDYSLRTRNRSGRARVNPRVEHCSIDSGVEDRIEKVANRTNDNTAVNLADAASGKRGQELFVTPQGKNISVIDPPASQRISDNARHIDRVILQHLSECRSDFDYWHSTWLKKARQAAHNEVPQSKKDVPTSVFKDIKPLTMVRNVKANSKIAVMHFEVFENAKSTKTQAGIPCDTFAKLNPRDEDLPKYQHYVSIKHNFLANNDTILKHWPYLGDDVDVANLTNLRDLYFVDIDFRQRKLECMLKAEGLADYTDGMLSAIDITWEDILRFLLDENPQAGTDHSALQALRARDKLCTEDFLRGGVVSTAVRSALPEYEPSAVGRAAIFCQRFYKHTRLQPWHIARRCDFVKNCLANIDVEDPKTSICRICLRYHCPSHGEICESPDGNSIMPTEAAHDVDETDIINARKVNFRRRVECPPSVDSKDVVMPRKQRTDWGKSDYNMRHEHCGPYYPCYHPGRSCDEAHCICWTSNTTCEKMCSCASDCKRRWQGCSCRAEKAKKGQKMICYEDSRCICFQNSRECDADLCGECGVCDVLDPVNRYNEEMQVGHCHNASMQRGVPKRTLLGWWGVVGFGLYSGDYIREHEFVGEYRGEVITKEEAERRGAVNEQQKLSYLFSLNKTQEIDGTYFGNKVRFINHAQDSKANLYPRIVSVNTQHRIGLYSRRKIKPGEELFFDYGPEFPDTQLGGSDKTSKKSTPQKANKSIPHVRNAQLTRGFIDVEYERDALGNRRAVKVGQAGKQNGIQRRHPVAALDGEDVGEHDSEREHEGEAAVGNDEVAAPPSEFPTHEEELEIGAQKQPDAGQRLDFYISNEGGRAAMNDNSNNEDDIYDESQPEENYMIDEFQPEEDDVNDEFQPDEDDESASDDVDEGFMMQNYSDD